MFNQDTAHLKSHLKALHADLSQTGAVDDELQALLRQLDGDIQMLLERRTEAAEAAPPAEPADLSGRTQEIAARFAVEHPRLEPALRELGRMLADMGI